MKRTIQVICGGLLLSILLSCSSQTVPQTEKPNVIILLTDDMGYGELGSYGQEVIQTPYLDDLASQSLRFTDFYAGSAVCSPSRAVLMTGKHAGHTSIRGNGGRISPTKSGRVELIKSEKTIAEMLKDAGYQTAMIGKWHLGVPQDTSTWANGRGFDYAVQEQWGISVEGQELDERMHWINNRMDSSFYDYNKYKCLDEFRTNFALEYLDKKSNDRPFFLYMSYRIPHAHEFFLSKNDLYNEYQQKWPEIERRHAARITMFDAQVKRLIDKLDKSGELDNTLIIFTSDNGPHHENYHDHEFFNSSGGLKGHKRDLYEGGIRVPTFVYWRGKITPGVTDEMFAAYDILPTIAEVSGAHAPADVDGISFLSLLQGEEQQKHDFLYWEIHEKGSIQAARFDNYKAVRHTKKNRTELYDLDKDLYEENDIAAQYPELVEKANTIFKEESIKSERYPASGGLFGSNKKKKINF